MSFLALLHDVTRVIWWKTKKEKYFLPHFNQNYEHDQVDQKRFDFNIYFLLSFFLP